MTALNSIILLIPIKDNTSLQITKSGWIDYYHVIEENGDINSTIHRVMTIEQIKLLYNITINNEMF